MRAAVFLAELDENTVASFREVACEQGVPGTFLAKILRSLADAGIVTSVRGPRGGFRLSRPAHEITFLEIIEAADGPIALNQCTDNGSGCDLMGGCQIHRVWNAGQNALVGVFRETLLSDLGTKSNADVEHACVDFTQLVERCRS